MRILRQYVLREFLAPVFYCFLAFASLYVIIELFGEFDKILPARPPVSMVLKYLGGYLAKDFQWLITPSLLLGGLYTMWQLARHSELTAMRANGISFWAITSPMIVASLFFALLTAANSELYAPEATRLSSAIKAANFTGYGPNAYTNAPYNNIKCHREWQMETFSVTNGAITNVKVTWTDNDGRPIQTLESPFAQYVGKSWWFENAMMKHYTNHITNAHVLTGSSKRDLLIVSDFTETPRDFVLEFSQGGILIDSVNMSAKDMIRFVDSRPNLAPEARTSWMYDIANRFAAPFACIVITLFAIPAGVATGRQSVFFGVASAILMFLVFYVLTISFGVMAKKGVFPIYVGILVPNAIFLIAGMLMYRRQR